MTKQRKWRDIGQGDFPPAFRFTQKDQWIEGVYKKTREFDSKTYKGQKNYVYEVEIKSASHKVRPGLVSIFKTGHLKWLFDQAKLKGDEYIRLVFQGKVKPRKGKGKKPISVFTLQVEE